MLGGGVLQAKDFVVWLLKSGGSARVTKSEVKKQKMPEDAADVQSEQRLTNNQNGRSDLITSDLQAIKDQRHLNLLTPPHPPAHGSATQVILGLECVQTALWVTALWWVTALQP